MSLKLLFVVCLSTIVLFTSCKVYETFELENKKINENAINYFIKQKIIYTVENAEDNRYLIKNPIITKDSISGILIRAKMGDHPTYEYERFKDLEYNIAGRILHFHTKDSLSNGDFKIARKSITKISHHKPKLGSQSPNPKNIKK